MHRISEHTQDVNKPIKMYKNVQPHSNTCYNFYLPMKFWSRQVEYVLPTFIPMYTKLKKYPSVVSMLKEAQLNNVKWKIYRSRSTNNWFSFHLQAVKLMILQGEIYGTGTIFQAYVAASSDSALCFNTESIYFVVICASVL